MSREEKREILFDWIRHMDEEGLDELLEEYFPEELDNNEFE